MLEFLGAVLLFVINFALAIYLFARTLLLPATLLVVEPTQLARRFLRRIRGPEGPSGVIFDVNVDARDLNRTLQSRPFLAGMVAAMLVAFALSQQLAYLMLGAAFLIGVFASFDADKFDERSFEQFARALAAVSDLVLVGLLLFFTVFRVAVDGFALLAFLFLAREALLFWARRWLESAPDFEPYDPATGDNPNTRLAFTSGEGKLTVGVAETDALGLRVQQLDRDPETEP